MTEPTPADVPGVILLSGIPGVGKTTTARALAQRLGRCAHIEGDLIQDLVIAGSCPPGYPDEAEMTLQFHLRERNMGALADNFAACGIVPIVDDVIVTSDRVERMLAAIRTRPVSLVILTPPLDVALDRDGHRDKRVAAQWAHLDEELRSELPGVGLWIDNSSMSIDAVVDLIVREGRDRGRIA